jgi:transcriptional regulator with XRE-family HTH domain
MGNTEHFLNGARGAAYPNLKLQLWRSGIRQNRLAQLIGIDETLLSRIVNGFRAPDPIVRAQIASVLSADESWLFATAPAPLERLIPEKRTESGD